MRLTNPLSLFCCVILLIGCKTDNGDTNRSVEEEKNKTTEGISVHRGASLSDIQPESRGDVQPGSVEFSQLSFGSSKEEIKAFADRNGFGWQEEKVDFLDISFASSTDGQEAKRPFYGVSRYTSFASSEDAERDRRIRELEMSNLVTVGVLASPNEGLSRQQVDELEDGYEERVEELQSLEPAVKSIDYEFAGRSVYEVEMAAGMAGLHDVKIEMGGSFNTLIADLVRKYGSPSRSVMKDTLVSNASEQLEYARWDFEDGSGIIAYASDKIILNYYHVGIEDRSKEMEVNKKQRVRRQTEEERREQASSEL
jgi:hypothetical protein